MKQALALFLLLVLLSCGALAGAGAALDGRKDAVSITETVLAGDPAFAADLELTAVSHCDYRLFWESRLTPGDPDGLETAFSFHPQRLRQEQAPREPELSLSCADLGIGTSGELDFSEHPMLNTMRAPLLDVAARAAAGEPYAETVELGDYFAYLPICTQFSGFRYSLVEDGTLDRLFQDYFRVPIPEGGCRVELTVTKNPRGGINHVNISTVDGRPSLDTQCVTDGPDLLFAVQGELQDREAGRSLPLDGGLVPGGWGIHRLSGVESDRPALSPAYSLPEGARLLRFWSGGDGGPLFLITREEGLIRLRVLDRATVAPVQTLDLLPFAGEEDGVGRLCLGDGFLVVPTFSGPFVLLEREADGTWAVRLTGDTAQQAELGCRLSGGEQLHMLWDGERLAAAGPWRGESSGDGYNGFYVAVYDREGLRYLGRYGHSLDGNNGGSPICQPTDLLPWTLAPAGRGRAALRSRT